MEAVDAASPWPDLLRRAWPGALRSRQTSLGDDGRSTLKLEGTD